VQAYLHHGLEAHATFGAGTGDLVSTKDATDVVTGVP
jgi:hypothetical protein